MIRKIGLLMILCAGPLAACGDSNVHFAALAQVDAGDGGSPDLAESSVSDDATGQAVDVGQLAPADAAANLDVAAEDVAAEDVAAEDLAAEVAGQAGS